jgi:hypothetical protein
MLVLAGTLLGSLTVLAASIPAPAANAPSESPLATSSPSEAIPSEAPSVRGSWVISPDVPGQSFQALAAFGAGGVFITTGSDEPGTGIGQWVAQGSDGFGFSYTNFHFGPDGTLAHTTTVNAVGTFEGDTMTGTATEYVTDAHPGAGAGVARKSTFTGQRMTVTAP